MAADPRTDLTKDEVDRLLQSVLVPAKPPNRSQWKKLELAMKFIQASKKAESRRGSVTSVHSVNSFRSARRPSSSPAPSKECLDIDAFCLDNCKIFVKGFFNVQSWC